MTHLQKFLNGRVPEVPELAGDWVVRGLFGPLPLRFFGHLKQFRELEPGCFEGSNRFMGRIRTGWYYASAGASQLTPELRVININYDHPRNARIMRPLTDEVRFVSDDVMLGRGIYAPTGWRPRNIFWFTVSRI